MRSRRAPRARDTERAVVGGIEAGGNKFVCAIGSGPQDVRAHVVIPTGRPEVTLAGALAFFREQPEAIAALGIASFGPIDLDSTSPTCGFITTTPKPGWANIDLVGAFRALGVPVAFDTDVNGAALGESRWGAGRGVDPLVYVTVGTGVGGGAIVNGRLLHGLVHPEMGHLRLPHDRAADPFVGTCPYHGDCLDGLASGTAIRARWGAAPDTLAPEHPAWDLEADYLALGLVSVIATLSPRRIILGGGVMGQPRLLPGVRRRLVALMAGYLRARQLTDDIDAYVVPPQLGARAGVLGAIALAQGSSASARALAPRGP